MTNQEIFEKVVAHLRQQGGPAMAPSEKVPNLMVCRYRTPDGLKCAIGCLIHDDDYIAEIEGACATDSVVVGRLPFSVETDDRRGLLVDLQEVHDHTDPEQWETALVGIALKYQLVYPLP